MLMFMASSWPLSYGLARDRELRPGNGLADNSAGVRAVQSKLETRERPTAANGIPAGATLTPAGKDGHTLQVVEN